MVLPIYSYIPASLTVILLIYFIFENYKTYRMITSEITKKILFWLIAAGICTLLWGIDFLYSNSVQVPESTYQILWAVRHIFIFIAVICLAIAAKYIGEFGKEFGFK